LARWIGKNKLYLPMVVYDSAYIYIESASDLLDKIAKIEAVLVAMNTALLKAVTGETVSEYSIDDGQTKIKTVSRSISDITRGINGLERIKQGYINTYNGRASRLVDSKSLRH
jgi:hypothetical protein